MARRRIDFDPHDGALGALLASLATARGADDRLAAAEEFYRAESLGRRATGEAINHALAAGYSARAIGAVLGMTHAAVTARARAARTGRTEDTSEEGTAP